jgi:hypothetical protein
MSQAPSCYDGYSSLNSNTTLDLDEIDVFRKRLIQNLADLNLNKHRFKTHDFNQLSNYHQYSLNILNNMQNIRQVEMSNPYNRNMQNVRGANQPAFETINPYTDNLKVIYKRDGSTQIIGENEHEKKFVGEWETMFSSNMINPPSFLVPPNNCWSTSHTK